MDLNYLLSREQISLIRAANAADSCVRKVHEQFARGYGALIAAGPFPHPGYADDCFEPA